MSRIYWDRSWYFRIYCRSWDIKIGRRSWYIEIDHDVFEIYRTSWIFKIDRRSWSIQIDHYAWYSQITNINHIILLDDPSSPEKIGGAEVICHEIHPHGWSGWCSAGSCPWPVSGGGSFPQRLGPPKSNNFDELSTAPGTKRLKKRLNEIGRQMAEMGDVHKGVLCVCFRDFHPIQVASWSLNPDCLIRNHYMRTNMTHIIAVRSLDV